MPATPPRRPRALRAQTTPLTPAAVRAALLGGVGFLAALGSPAAARAQAGAPAETSDWLAPVLDPSRFFRLSAEQSRLPGAVDAGPFTGLEAAFGTGLHRRFGVTYSYAFALGRGGEYRGLVPGQQVGAHRAEVVVTPAVAATPQTSLHGALGGGIRAWSPMGGVGQGNGTTVVRWFLSGGLEWRRQVAARATVDLGARYEWTPLADGEFNGWDAGPAATGRGLLRFRVGLSFHERRGGPAGDPLERFPRGEAAPRGTPDPLAPSTGRVIGHVDGVQDHTSDGRPNTRYTGPQRFTVLFKAQSTEFTGQDDHTRLVAVGRLLSEVPGTIVVLRAWDDPGVSPIPARQMGEKRGERLRDIILAAAPYVNPQRVTIIPMGPDYSVKSEDKARRIDVEFYRP